MSRLLTRKTALIAGAALLVLLALPVALTEGLYWYCLRNLHDVPPLPPAVKVESKFADAIWANAGESPPYALEPIRPWDGLIQFYLTERQKLAPGTPYTKGENIANACGRIRIRELEIQRRSVEHRLARFAEVVWLSRNATADDLTSCIYEKSLFPCDAKGYTDAAVKLLNKSPDQLELIDILTLAAVAYYGPAVETRMSPVKTRRDQLIDIYLKNGIIPQPFAEELKKEPAPEAWQCPKPSPDGG